MPKITGLKVLLISIALAIISAHKWCGGTPQVPKVYVDTYGENKRFLQSTTYQAIRIYVDYEFLNTQTTVDPNKVTAAKKIVDQTVEMYKKVLKVKPVSGKLKLKDEACSGAKFSSLVTTTGVDYDIVIVPFFDLKAEATTEAYASFCQQDLTTKRPIAGIMAFTQNLALNTNWLEYNSYLVFHEFAHILVFNAGLFSEFIDSNGKNIDESKIKSTATVNGVQRTKIITPKVIAASKKHFGCDSIDGLELENQGGEGTAGAHWEARLMMTDFMMGKSYDEIVISDITMAFFEDSGWYQVNYLTGGLFRWGKNEGCSFINSKCISSGKSNFGKEFCDTAAAPTCSNGRVSKGSCSIETINNLNSNYQYFSNAKSGGYELADYCPVSTADDVDGYYIAKSCIFGVNTDYPAGLEEKISSTSACFISSLVNNSNSASLTKYVDVKRSICYQFSCDYNAKTLSVMIGSNSVNCPAEGGAASVTGYSGTISCPDFATFCTQGGVCNSMVDCINKGITAYGGSTSTGTGTGTTGTGTGSTTTGTGTGSTTTGTGTGTTGTGTGSTTTGTGSGSTSDSNSIKIVRIFGMLILILVIF